jgi:hypothetical protein
MKRESESTAASKIRSTNSASDPRNKSLRPARTTLGPRAISEAAIRGRSKRKQLTRLRYGLTPSNQVRSGSLLRSRLATYDAK